MIGSEASDLRAALLRALTSGEPPRLVLLEVAVVDGSRLEIPLDPSLLLFCWSEMRWFYRSVFGLLPIELTGGRWVLRPLATGAELPT